MHTRAPRFQPRPSRARSLGHATCFVHREAWAAPLGNLKCRDRGSGMVDRRGSYERCRSALPDASAQSEDRTVSIPSCSTAIFGTCLQGVAMVRLRTWTRLAGRGVPSKVPDYVAKLHTPTADRRTAPPKTTRWATMARRFSRCRFSTCPTSPSTKRMSSPLSSPQSKSENP